MLRELPVCCSFGPPFLLAESLLTFLWEVPGLKVVCRKAFSPSSASKCRMVVSTSMLLKSWTPLSFVMRLALFWSPPIVADGPDLVRVTLQSVVEPLDFSSWPRFFCYLNRLRCSKGLSAFSITASAFACCVFWEVTSLDCSVVFLLDYILSWLLVPPG